MAEQRDEDRIIGIADAGTTETLDATDDDSWADSMADGEDYDESIGERADDERILSTDELDEIGDDDAPEGAQARDEEFEGDDPADIPEEQGGSPAAYDADGDGVPDELPEGTDRIVDESDDDWE